MTPNVLRSGIVGLFLSIAAAVPGHAEDLVELYLQAREFDPDFQSARLQREIALESLRDSKAGVLPALTADLDTTKEYTDVPSSGNVQFVAETRDFTKKRFAITLTQPIYRADLYYRIPQAKAEVRQAEANFTLAEQEMIFRLGQAHFNYLSARDNLELAAAERTAIGRQLAEAEERLGSGLTTITEVHEARARFAVAQAEEINAVDKLEEYRMAIAEITGIPPNDLMHLSEIFPLVEPDSPDIEQWVEAARFRNPRLVALQAAVDIARQEIRKKRGQRLPTLDFVVTYSRDEASGSASFNDSGYELRTTDVALRLGIPIFDGGRVGAQTRSASLQMQIAAQNLERERRRVEGEVRSSFHGVMSGIDRVEALVKSVFSNEAALSAKEEGLRSGVDTGIDVLNARRELFSARRDLSRARYSYILNSLRLKQSAGVLGEHDLRQINAYLQ